MRNSGALIRLFAVGTAIAIFVCIPSGRAGDLNPAALSYKQPQAIKWMDTDIGAKTAVLLGDPSKPGLYIILVKCPNNRYATVLSGTWWVGTGSKFDPSSTVPMPTGSFITHFGKQVHYDGAEDDEVVLQIVGEGPETTTPAEEK